MVSLIMVIFCLSQLGQAETAKVIWSNLMTQYPDVMGKENPYNEKIHTIFGDQGGYR